MRTGSDVYSDLPEYTVSVEPGQEALPHRVYTEPEKTRTCQCLLNTVNITVIILLFLLRSRIAEDTPRLSLSVGRNGVKSMLNIFFIEFESIY